MKEPFISEEAAIEDADKQRICSCVIFIYDYLNPEIRSVVLILG
jgi:hypothetical protein